MLTGTRMLVRAESDRRGGAHQQRRKSIVLCPVDSRGLVVDQRPKGFPHYLDRFKQRLSQDRVIEVKRCGVTGELYRDGLTGLL